MHTVTNPPQLGVKICWNCWSVSVQICLLCQCHLLIKPQLYVNITNALFVCTTVWHLVWRRTEGVFGVGIDCRLFPCFSLKVSEARKFKSLAETSDGLNPKPKQRKLSITVNKAKCSKQKLFLKNLVSGICWSDKQIRICSESLFCVFFFKFVCLVMQGYSVLMLLAWKCVLSLLVGKNDWADQCSG